jgi:hypothetical protein
LPTGSLGAELQKVLGEKRKHPSSGAGVNSLSNESFSSNTLGSLNTNFKKNKSDLIESIKQEGEIVGGGAATTKLLLTSNETSLTKLSLNPPSQESTPSSQDISKKVNKFRNKILEFIGVLRIEP